MFWYQVYMLFALTTGATACYELLAPVIAAIKRERPMQSETLFYIVFFILCTLAAPLIFLSCIIPSFGDAAKIKLKEELSKEF